MVDCFAPTAAQDAQTTIRPLAMDVELLRVSLVPSARFRTALADEGGAATLWLLERAAERVEDAGDEVRDELRALADDAYARCWERLHGGSWQDVAPVWREAFGRAALLKAWSLGTRGEHVECIKTLDMCLMMAGPLAPSGTHAFIAAVERELPVLCPARAGGDFRQLDVSPSAKDRTSKKPRLEQGDAVGGGLKAAASPTIRFPVERVAMPSLNDFHRKIMTRQEPMVITGAMENWPALGRRDEHAARSWHDVEYFRRVAGWRTVPIEVGSSYLEDDWRQELMAMSEFLDKYIVPMDGQEEDTTHRQVGYLAQHHLFEQISVLGRDIMTPDYCALRRQDLEDNPGSDEEEEEDENIAVNAWFGPADTVSPLHFDPKDNLLCQVVGSKYLRLYSPLESDKLYPVEGLLSNTSQVQVEAAAESVKQQFPRFQDAKYVECVLQPGEMLYIPPLYWHYVRSLSTSFSVSFWWD